MSAILAIHKLQNRSQKHKYRNEATRAAEYLQHVVDDFIDALFDAPDQFKYDVIYQEFHDQWNDTCNHLKSVKPRFRTIIIDDKFFAKQYSPEVTKTKKFATRFEIVIF